MYQLTREQLCISTVKFKNINTKQTIKIASSQHKFRSSFSPKLVGYPDGLALAVSLTPMFNSQDPHGGRWESAPTGCSVCGTCPDIYIHTYLNKQMLSIFKRVKNRCHTVPSNFHTYHLYILFYNLLNILIGWQYDSSRIGTCQASLETRVIPRVERRVRSAVHCKCATACASSQLPPQNVKKNQRSFKIPTDQKENLKIHLKIY